MLEKIRRPSETLELDEVMAYINKHYIYRPTASRNSGLINQSGQDEGSCKTLAFAKPQGSNQQETL